MERQTVLVRNGWRFIRLRGSEYFRNKEVALERVVRYLKALGIEPETEGDVASGTPAATPLLERVKTNYERLAAGEAIDEQANEATETAEATDVTNSFDVVPLIARGDLATFVPAEPTTTESEAHVASHNEPHDKPLDPAALEARPFVRALLSALATNTAEPLRVTADATGLALLARSGAAAARIAASDDDSELITLEILRTQGLRARGLPAAVDKNGDYRVWRLDASAVGDDEGVADLARRFAAYVQRVAVKMDKTT